MAPFLNSLEHLLVELDRIDARVRLCLWRAQRGAQKSKRRAAPQPHGMPRWSSSREYPCEDWPDMFARLEDDLQERRRASRARGVELRLFELAERSSLSPRDLDLFLLALASEIDPGYEAVFAYLQGKPAPQRLSMNLALDLLCASLPEKLECSARLAPCAPLVRAGLVRVRDGGAELPSPWLARVLEVDEPIIRFLTDDSAPLDWQAIHRDSLRRPTRAFKVGSPGMVRIATRHIR